MTISSRPALKSSKASSSRPASKSSKASAPQRRVGRDACPITCGPIKDKSRVTSTFKSGNRTKEVAYDKEAITAWLKKYSVCPATNQEITKLTDKDGKVVWKKSAAKKTPATLTLPILLEMHARLDRMDRVTPPALDRLQSKYTKASKETKAKFLELGIKSKGDLLSLQEKIDRVASVVTTAHFIGRLALADRTLKNLVALLKGIRTRIGQQIKGGQFKGFAQQSLSNKRAILSKILLNLGKLKEQRGPALEKSFGLIASKLTTPLELEQVCSIAPQVLLFSTKA